MAYFKRDIEIYPLYAVSNLQKDELSPKSDL